MDIELINWDALNVCLEPRATHAYKGDFGYIFAILLAVSVAAQGLRDLLGFLPRLVNP